MKQHQAPRTLRVYEPETGCVLCLVRLCAICDRIVLLLDLPTEKRDHINRPGIRDRSVEVGPDLHPPVIYLPVAMPCRGQAREGIW